MELVCDIGDAYDVGIAEGSVLHAVEVASTNQEECGGIPESVHYTPMDTESVAKSAKSEKTIWSKVEKDGKKMRRRGVIII